MRDLLHKPLGGWIRAAGLLFISSFAVHCSSGKPQGANLDEAQSAGPSVAAQLPECTAGLVQECTVTLGEEGGVLSCYKGEQTCEASGTWSGCMNGAGQSQDAAVQSGGLPPFSARVQTASETCPANPCDPACRAFETVPEPEAGGEGGGGGEAGVGWESGPLETISNLPPGLEGKGITEPCTSGEDCQYHMYCNQPAAGECAHSGCELGVALADECHPCVATVCEALPDCCSMPECAPGQTEFEGQCYWYSGSQTDTWDNARVSCQALGAGWDLAVIDSAEENALIYSLIDEPAWIAITDQDAFSSQGTWVWAHTDPPTVPAYTNWRSGEPDFDNKRCGRMRDKSNGNWQDHKCNHSHEYVCEGPPSASALLGAEGPGWVAACVDAFADVCGIPCGQDDALPDASCALWLPEMTNERCTGFNLTAGIPCEDTIPVCNTGLQNAPAGVVVSHWPANSIQFPTTTPDTSHPQMKSCVTDAEILPGECIGVMGCAADLTGNRSIMVNPPGASEVEECSHLDNWTLFSSGTECGSPLCADAHGATEVQSRLVDIIFIVDNSGSMTGEINAIQDRINVDFAEIIAASGVDYRVIMFARYGDVNHSVGGSNNPICIGPPLGNSCANADSDQVQNNAPRFYHYSADVESRDSWCDLLHGYSNSDEIAADSRPWTPLAPSGWSQYLRPGSFKVFVEVTDDRVDCNKHGYDFDDQNNLSTGASEAAEFDAALLALSEADFGTAEQREYIWHSIIAIEESSPSTSPWEPTDPTTTQECSPGAVNPGTGYQALSVLTGGLRYPICNNDNFDAIFNTIAEGVVEIATAGCTYYLPNAENYDPEAVGVSWVDDGQTVNLSGVASEAECGVDNWYWADQDASLLELCPGVCSDVEGATDAQVRATAACLVAGGGGAVYSQVYQATCSAEQSPLWQFLFYDVEIADGGSMEFHVRSAATEAGLASQPYVEAAVALEATKLCHPSGAPACSVDFAGPLADQNKGRWGFLELQGTAISGSGSAPTVNSWEVRHTCVDSE